LGVFEKGRPALLPRQHRHSSPHIWIIPHLDFRSLLLSFVTLHADEDGYVHITFFHSGHICPSDTTTSFTVALDSFSRVFHYSSSLSVTNVFCTLNRKRFPTDCCLCMGSHLLDVWSPSYRLDTLSSPILSCLSCCPPIKHIYS
jgi:hypothetical protein